MTNPQQTEGLTAEQEVALDALEILHTFTRSRAELATSHNAEMDAHMRQIAALISHPNLPAQEAVAWRYQKREWTPDDWLLSNEPILRDASAYNIQPLYTSPPEQSSLTKVLTEALETASTALYEASDKFHILSGYIKDEAVRQCAKEKVYEMTNANIIARKALSMAKEGNNG